MPCRILRNKYLKQYKNSDSVEKGSKFDSLSLTQTFHTNLFRFRHNYGNARKLVNDCH